MCMYVYKIIYRVQRSRENDCIGPTKSRFIVYLNKMHVFMLGNTYFTVYHDSHTTTLFRLNNNWLK